MSSILTNTNRKHLLYDEFINPNNILSLENLEENHENYILKAPRKGKLIRGPVCTAYKRQNLGSIPRKTENILIDELKIAKTTKGFLSQAQRFSSKVENVKYQFPGPGSYKTEKSFDHIVKENSYHSSKGFGNGFASISSRFEDYKEFYDKFMPGPGSYKEESTNMISTMSKTLSYKSLYNKPTTKTLKRPLNVPGPGTYNPLLLKKSEIDGENYYFKSDDLRFKKVPKSALGPGKYFKEGIDILLTKSPNKGRTDVSSGGRIDKNGNKTSSYFFKTQLEKVDDLVDKYINTNKLITRNIKTPGPGAYEIKKDHNFNWNFEIKEKKENIYIDTLKINKMKKRLQTAANKVPKPLIEMNLQNLNKNKIENNSSPKEFANNHNKGEFEEKNTYSPPRYPDYLLRKNIPGPAYYNPVVKPIKVNYNWNLERKWIL